MVKVKSATQSTRAPSGTAGSSLHRSGAVAQMLGMPVATLRVWERRYRLTRPALSPSGQRLYSADDVRRLALVKQLADQGHAIGSLAPLDMRQLQQVASTHAQVRASTRQGARSDAAAVTPLQPWRLAVIGAGLGRRLQRPALLRRLGRPLELLGPFDDVVQAAAALAHASVDALLIHEAHLHEGWLAAIDAAAPAFVALPRAVLYGFAADAVCNALADAGLALLREPQPDVVLAQWLKSLSSSAITQPPAADPPPLVHAAVLPRRWGDAALVEFAGLPSTIVCECPRHVAELLLLLSHFEAYSAECGHRNAADADLHAHLRRVAEDCRARFEGALELIALHEGLVLPASVIPGGRAEAQGALRTKSLPAARHRHRA